MTMTRKTLWNAGFAVLLAGSAFAVERDRGTSEVVDGDAQAAKPKIEFRQVGPGVAVATMNGVELKVHANGSVALDEIMAQFGSMDRYDYERSSHDATTGVNPQTGDTMRADGAVAFFRGVAPAAAPKPPALTLDEYKSDVAWVEQDFGGVKVIAFANGAVLLNDAEQQRVPDFVAHRAAVANAVSEKDNTRRYATGAVFANEPTAAPEPK